MASPAYIDNGGLAVATDGDLDIAYPGTVSADDILLIQVLSDDAGTHGAISGFTKVTQRSHSTVASASWYWKRATGSESGTVNCLNTDTSGLFVGVMSRWSGCIASGTPYEQQQEADGVGNNSVSSSAITPVTDENRVVCLVCVEDNTYSGPLTGGNYANNFSLEIGRASCRERVSDYV